MSAETEDPPLLYIVGGSSRTVLRASSLAITSIAQAISCPDVSVNKTAHLEYVWSEVLTNDTFVSTSAVSNLSLRAKIAEKFTKSYTTIPGVLWC